MGWPAFDQWRSSFGQYGNQDTPAPVTPSALLPMAAGRMTATAKNLAQQRALMAQRAIGAPQAAPQAVTRLGVPLGPTRPYTGPTLGNSVGTEPRLPVGAGTGSMIGGLVGSMNEAGRGAAEKRGYTNAAQFGEPGDRPRIPRPSYSQSQMFGEPSEATPQPALAKPYTAGPGLSSAMRGVAGAVGGVAGQIPGVAEWAGDRLNQASGAIRPLAQSAMNQQFEANRPAFDARVDAIGAGPQARAWENLPGVANMRNPDKGFLPSDAQAGDMFKAAQARKAALSNPNDPRDTMDMSGRQSMPRITSNSPGLLPGGKRQSAEQLGFVSRDPERVRAAAEAKYGQLPLDQLAAKVRAEGQPALPTQQTFAEWNAARGGQMSPIRQVSDAAGGTRNQTYKEALAAQAPQRGYDKVQNAAAWDRIRANRAIEKQNNEGMNRMQAMAGMNPQALQAIGNNQLANAQLARTRTPNQDMAWQILQAQIAKGQLGPSAPSLLKAAGGDPAMLSGLQEANVNAKNAAMTDRIAAMPEGERFSAAIAHAASLPEAQQQQFLMDNHITKEMLQQYKENDLSKFPLLGPTKNGMGLPLPRFQAWADRMQKGWFEQTPAEKRQQEAMGRIK